jgi:hypothetical protein
LRHGTPLGLWASVPLGLRRSYGCYAGVALELRRTKASLTKAALPKAALTKAALTKAALPKAALTKAALELRCPRLNLYVKPP